MPIEIVGRDEEVASVRAFVEGAAEGPAAFVLEGEAGVGKSTVWLAGVEHARAERGCRHSSRGRPKPSVVSRTLLSATSSEAWPTTCCRRYLPRVGARWRSRFSAADRS